MTEARGGGEAASPAAQIDATIAALGDWRGPVLAKMRELIRAADPEVVEAVKWRKPTNPFSTALASSAWPWATSRW